MDKSDWLPLESSPDIMNDYVQKIGFNSIALSFQDLLGLESWAIDMLGKPVLAFLLTYNVTPAQSEHKTKEEEMIKTKGQSLSPSLFYMKQKAGNACGTIALLHALAPVYLTKKDLFVPESVLSKLYDESKGKSAEEIADSFCKNEKLKISHTSAVEAGSTEVREDCDNHFICVAYHDGAVYELDGCKLFPIKHGECTEEGFPEEGLKVLRSYVERDPGNAAFNIIALAGAPQL